MTVLEWLEASTMYSSFTEKNLVKIALDRGVEPTSDVYDESVVTKRERDLLSADLIYAAVLFRPSDTASLQQSHNGYQKTVGQEKDYYQDTKIKYAIGIYELYGDERAATLENIRRKIKFIPIEDVVRL